MFKSAIRFAKAAQLPDETLLFPLGSRNCETDPLLDSAWQLFDQPLNAWERVQAICD